MRVLCCCVMICLSASWLPAQFNNADFEASVPPLGQVAAQPPTVPWSSIGVSEIGPHSLLPSFATVDGGFPSSGSQWLYATNFGLGPSTPPAGGAAATGAFGEVRQTFVVPTGGFASLTFDWTFVTSEITNNATFNDWASIDIEDSTTGIILVNLLACDTFLGAVGGGVANIPGATGGPAGPGVFSPGSGAFFGNEADPVGPKTAIYGPVALATLVPGTAYDLVIRVGNAGDSVAETYLYVDNITPNIPLPPPPPPTHQLNGPTASLAFTGTECVIGAIPSVRVIAPGGSTTMTISSSTNGEQAYLLAVTPGFGVPAAGLTLPGVGILDFDLAGLGVMNFVIDGIGNSNGLIDQLLGTTTAAATRDLVFTVGIGAGTLGTFQAAVVDPTTGSGLQLTQATQIDYAGVSVFPAAPLVVPGVTDDSTTQIMFGAFGAFDFYGVNYLDIFVNSNGNCTFGAGNTDFSQSLLEFETNQPRIAPFWRDLNPTQGGSITYDDTAGMFSVVYADVPEFFDVGANSARIDLLPGGVIQLTYGVTTTPDGIVGISPGGAALPTTLGDFTALQNLGSTISGGPSDPLAEDFTAGNPFDLGDSLCGGIAAGPIFFVPNGGFAVPGDTGYTAP